MITEDFVMNVYTTCLLCEWESDHYKHISADDAVEDARRHIAEMHPEPTDLPLGHGFLPVNGHPDDDECTHRSDGTDATYCGEPEAAHRPTEQESK